MNTVTFDLQLLASSEGEEVPTPAGAILNRSGLLSASCILMRATARLWTF